MIISLIKTISSNKTNTNFSSKITKKYNLLNNDQLIKIENIFNKLFFNKKIDADKNNIFFSKVLKKYGVFKKEIIIEIKIEDNVATICIEERPGYLGISDEAYPFDYHSMIEKELASY